MEAGQQEAVMEYAGFWIRLAAFIIDGIISSCIFFIIGVILGIILVFWEGMSLDAFLGIWYVDVLLGVVYYVGFWTWRGQTPGKMLVRIKIVRTDGSSIGLGRAFIRYLMFVVGSIASLLQSNFTVLGGRDTDYFLSTINLLVLVGFLWVAFDSHKQGIHDKLADTYVVKLTPKR